MSRELLADYPLSSTRFDEMLEAPLTPRAHWRPMFEQLSAASAALMKERIQAVQRQVRENGVTYNVYADPEGADRPWELDVLPLIIPPGEWREIAAALAQRAKLLDLILGDIYGEQALLREGLLPRRWCTGTPSTCARAAGRSSPATCGCTCTRPTWRARPTDAGG